jgi:SAM-dependent methyltransferase
MDTLKLNIGAGQTYIPGFINLDISPRADITLDLNRDPLPFDNDSVDLIFSYHTLEHIDNYLFALGEIHRVLKHGGYLFLGLPYVTLTEYHLVNPYHLHNFNEYSFDFFDPEKLRGSAAENTSVMFRKIFHRFHYIGAFNLVFPPFQTWCRRHLFNVVRKIDFGLVAIKDVSQPIYVGENPRRLMKEFDECLRARVPYGTTKLPPEQNVWLRKKLKATLRQNVWLRKKLKTTRRWWAGRYN